MKLPSLQFYPGDWRKDPGVQSLTYHDRGIWFELLLLMHESSDRGKLLLNGLPFPEDALARLLGLDKQSLTNTITTLLACGVASRDSETGALMNRRMVRDEHIRIIRAESGKKGGNPVLLNQKSTTMDKQKQTTRLKQNPTPSSSSSISASSSECTPRTPPQPIAEAKPDRARSLSPDHNDVVHLLQFYLDEYNKAFKSQPNMPNRKKYQDIQDEIDRIGLDELKRRMLCYFKDPGKQKAFWRFEFFLAIHSEYDSKMNAMNGRATGTGNTNLDKTIEAGRRFIEKHNGENGNAAFKTGTE